MFSLQNSTAYIYPKNKTCLLLELGVAGALVTVSCCDVLLHFDTDRDMQLFLQQRRRALNDRHLMPPPDSIFMIWIVFVVPSASAGKGKKSGRYSMRIEGDVLEFRAKSGSDSVVEIKLADCRIDVQPASIKMFCFWGEIEIHSADELDGLKRRLHDLMVK